MTGPEHYQAGEEALSQSEYGGNTTEQAAHAVAVAQAHFTAASAAASALAAARMDGHGWANMQSDLDDWHAAAAAG
jgi:hypothetical protein